MATAYPEDKITANLSQTPTAAELYTAPKLQASTFTPGTYEGTYAEAPELNIQKAETPTYDVNYNDERFQQVEADKQNAISDIESTYGDMIDQSDSFYQAQIDASKQWAATQSQLQQERTDFAIEQIEQEKEFAEQDYKKEQSAAYVDWQKQSGKYGTAAEQMAASGLYGSGYSESSHVSIKTVLRWRESPLTVLS